ncbi:MAG: hypothetical protein AAGA55_09455, partial [Planctomycetota bacterium]
LLIRDAGWLGYAVFFVPNVVGAGLMGFVLRSPEAAAELARKHAAMARIFSAVTIAFHIFWFAWVASFIRDVFPMNDTWVMVAAALGIAFAITSGRVVRFGAAPRAALVLWLVGLGTIVYAIITPNSLTPTTPDMIAMGTDATHAAWLLPVTVFGFMLCPYLDLTFLLARRSAPGINGGRIAFGVGFWVLFPVMIGLTAIYAGPLIAVLEGRGPTSVEPAVGAAILVHMIVQWVFTVRVHSDRLFSPIDSVTPATDEDRGRQMWEHPIPVAAIVFGALGAGLSGVFAASLPGHAGMSAGEIIYRGFLSAYGLLFPVYVWARMIPRTRRSTNAAWITACVFAAPCYWMGFIERDGVWLVPGILIALLVPLMRRESAVVSD